MERLGPEGALVVLRSESEKEWPAERGAGRPPQCHLVPLLGRSRESHMRLKRDGWVRMRNTGSLSDDWVTTLAMTLLLVGNQGYTIFQYTHERIQHHCQHHTSTFRVLYIPV